MSKIIGIFIVSSILFLGLGLVILAQETSIDVIEDVNLDENIQPEDLEVGEPQILPDHPLYFLKNWARGIRSFFAFNVITKAELKMKFANEKLMEVKKTIEKKKGPEAIKNSVDNYKEGIERIGQQAEKIKEKARENERVNSFLNKFIHQQILHQKLLSRLENQVPEQALEKIRVARERHLERFEQVMLKLEDRKEKITEKLTNILENQKGSNFKHFKNLEVLLELEEKVPEEAKNAIRSAQENSLKRLQGNLEKMSPENQEKFTEYLERISGNKEIQFEILENLKSGLQVIPETSRILELKENLEEGRKKMIGEISNKLEELNCPLWVLPPPGFCSEGRVIIEKSPEGCPLPPLCIAPGESTIPRKIIIPKGIKELPVPEPPIPAPLGEEPPSVCVTLWNPVCGKDGKTYSNECFVNSVEVEIDYKGICGKYEYYIHGSLTREASEENIGDLQKIAEAFQAGVSLMESFPMQFQIYPLASKNCIEVREILGTLEYIDRFSECRSRPIYPPPDSWEPIKKEL